MRNIILQSNLPFSSQRPAAWLWVHLLGGCFVGSVVGCSAPTNVQQTGAGASASSTVPAVIPSVPASVCNPGPTPAASDVWIRWGKEYQTMSGFGASSAFFGAVISAENADWLFSKETGIGLSLMRMRIGAPTDLNMDGTEPLGSTPVAATSEEDTAKQAVDRGAQVWAAAWTPPPLWKTVNCKNGGVNSQGQGKCGEVETTFMSNKLKESHYADYATYLADVYDSMAKMGVKLTGISPQNEPDYVASWDNAQWSYDELAKFTCEHLGPTFAARNINAKLIVPDTAHWPNVMGYVDALLKIPGCSKLPLVIATHPYVDAGQVADLCYSVPRDNGLEFWETEISHEHFPEPDVADPTMKSAVTMLRTIHDHVVKASMNAWSWWALSADEGDYKADPNRQNPALIQNNVRFKRGYALGNYAKFVRPGFKRIDASPQAVGSEASPLLVAAFKDTARLAIVVTNTDSVEHAQNFHIDGQAVTSVTPWITSETLSLEAQPAVTVGADGNFNYKLPAQSVVTFYADWTPPGSVASALPSSPAAASSPAATSAAPVQSAPPSAMPSASTAVASSASAVSSVSAMATGSASALTTGTAAATGAPTTTAPSTSSTAPMPSASTSSTSAPAGTN